MLIVRAAQTEDLYDAALARIASWHAAFTGLVPQDFLDAMDPAAIATSWQNSITAGRSRLYVAIAPDQPATNPMPVRADPAPASGPTPVPADPTPPSHDPMPVPVDPVPAYGGSVPASGGSMPAYGGSMPGFGRVVGYAGVGAARGGPPETGELYALFVHPEYWGTGAARLLTDAAVADLRSAGCVEVWLWVLEANARARAFYRRYGFTETPARTTSSLNNLPELRLTLPSEPPTLANLPPHWLIFRSLSGCSADDVL